MGWVGIHDPDALCYFNGLTHCPWCGKVGHNVGTVVNHLQMVHYRLGLVCNKCLIGHSLLPWQAELSAVRGEKP